MIGKKEIDSDDEEYDATIRLFGYTSCSLAKSAALNFAWERPETGHSKVLFHIKYNENCQAYYLDAGAYDYEKEVLLRDGVMLWVESVQEIKNKQGQVMHTLITLKSA